VLTGSVLVYARSISEFGAVVIIAYYPATAPVEGESASLDFSG
jgi:molybdate/tungstate transport system permease protein